MNPFVILLGGRDALLARETFLTYIYIYITEGAVQPTMRSAPEHNPCMTSEHSTTARWNGHGVGFEGGGKPEYPEKNPRSQIEID